MTASVIIKLITEVGWPLAQELLAIYHAGNKAPTAGEWAALAKLAEYSSADSLASAGVRIEDGKVVSNAP